VQGGTRNCKEMQKQQDSVTVSVGAKMRGGFELVGGSGDGFTECHRRMD
jgi:hypothetical protein